MPASFSPSFYSTHSFLPSKLPAFLFLLPNSSFHSSTLGFTAYVRGLTLIISPIISLHVILPNLRRTTYPRPRLCLPQNQCPGTGSEWRTAGRPPSSLEERVWGWRTGLTPVRWWSSSQVKKHLVQWWEGGRACAHTFKSDARLTAWVLLRSLMNSHTHAQERTHTLRFAALLLIRTKGLASISRLSTWWRVAALVANSWPDRTHG